MDKITIIIPVYNAEKTIKQCLDSILKQDYENFNIICIDDKSTDNSFTILESYEKKYPNIKILQNEENKGPSLTRNKGLSEALTQQNDYICFIDSDDWVERDYLSKLLYMFKNDDVLFTSCGYKYEKRNNKTFCNKKDVTLQFDLNQSYIEVIGDKNCFGFVWNKMFKSSMLKDMLFNGSAGEDLIFCIEYLDQAKNGITIHTSKKLYHYIKTKGSLSGLNTNIKKYKRQRPFFDYLDNLRETHKDNKMFVQMINSWYFLMALEFVHYAHTLKLKDDKRFFKSKTKQYHKDYIKCKEYYSSFRKLGTLVYLLQKFI